MKSLLAPIIVFVRRSGAATFLKRVVPRPLKIWAWHAAKSQHIVHVLGSKLWIPSSSLNRDIVADEYEPAVSARIASVLKKGMTFCDVGANLGIFTLFGARLVGEHGKVFAFEPVPDNYAVLSRNIALNRYTNVHALSSAVSDTRGVSEIFLSDFSGSHSMIGNPANATGVALPIETIRLDEVPGLDTIDVLKIDTEGTELAVLRGLGTLRPRHVILECNIERLNAIGISGRQFLQALRDLGFDHIENIDDPEQGLQAIEANQPSSLNLHLQRSEG